MFCGKCGANFEGNFCSNCGAEKDQSVQTFCPACGVLLTPGVRFCSQCGTAISSTFIEPNSVPVVPAVQERCSFPTVNSAYDDGYAQRKAKFFGGIFGTADTKDTLMVNGAEPKSEEIFPVAEFSAEFRPAEEIVGNCSETINEEIKEDEDKTQEASREQNLKNHEVSKKHFRVGSIITAAAVAIIVIVLVILSPSKLEGVRSHCNEMCNAYVGMVSGNDDYFMIDTYPDQFEILERPSLMMQESALEAIRYANNELGFNGSVYSRMVETSALMGYQSEENNKYKVSWTYHPDEGLEVTYEKK